MGVVAKRGVEDLHIGLLCDAVRSQDGRDSLFMGLVLLRGVRSLHFRLLCDGVILCDCFKWQ